MLRLLVKKWQGEQDEFRKRWKKLAKERGLPVKALRDAELLWADDLDRWVIPIRNNDGSIVQLERYNPYVTKESRHVRIRGTAGLDHALYGAEELGDKAKRKWPVWIVEGHWDRIALKLILEAANVKAIVVAVPGNNVFKQRWVDWLAGRKIVLCYDNDAAGINGRNRAWKLLGAHCPGMMMVAWPSELEEGYDVRDFYNQGGDWDGLQALVEPYANTIEEEKAAAKHDESSPDEIISQWPLLSSGKRPSLKRTFQAYEETMKMTPDLRDALRVIYAVIITNQIEQDSPLWAHIAGPPGSGKTLLITSCSEVQNTVFMSTLTANTLVSGFVLPGGKDPSLIPQLIGKTFVLKDFTEILSLTKPAKDKVYSHLRGAYDGLVQERFGNGPYREYKGHFSMVTGVTPKIFGEQTAELGERFLIFHLGRSSQTERFDIIRTAVQSTNNKRSLMEHQRRSEAAKDFLQWRILPDDIPTISDEHVERIIGLAELVSHLRATVQKDERRGEMVIYRPEPELGTRVAKQLAKLLIGLGLQRYPAEVLDDDYRIVARMAVNSCIGWNLEMVRCLMGEGATLAELVENSNIPYSTLNDHLEQLALIGAVYREKEERGGVGRKPLRYKVSRDVERAWKRAELDRVLVPVTVNPIAARLRNQAVRQGLKLRKNDKRGKEPESAVRHDTRAVSLDSVLGGMNGSLNGKPGESKRPMRIVLPKQSGSKVPKK